MAELAAATDPYVAGETGATLELAPAPTPAPTPVPMLASTSPDGTAGSGLAVAERLMNELAGTLQTLDDLTPYLERLVHAVNVNIDGCDAVGVTVVMEDRPRTAAYTTAETLEIDAVQYAVGDGPCLDAFRNGRENLVDFTGGEERWPAFMHGCDPGQVQSLFALPLESGGRRYGSLNLYGYARDAFQGAEVALIRMAAQRAADAVAAAVHVAGARAVAGQMEQAMASRAVIEQAKGVLMARHAIDEKVAFEVLRRQSQEQNLKLRVLASRLVAEAISSHSQAM